MLFIILLQLCAISMCLNPDQPNSNINLDNRTLSIFQIGGNSNIQNSQNLKNLVDSSIYTDKNEIDIYKSKVEDYAFYFTTCGEKLDGIWEFTPYDPNLDHLSNNILNHSKGRISSNFKCIGVPKLGSIMHIDVDLYDGDYKNKMYNFDIAFVQDFKNYTKDAVILENRKYNMQFWLYNFIHKSHSFNYVTNNTFVKRNSDDGMSITIESNQKGFNGFIKIKFNLIYLGKIDNFNINFYIVCNLLITLICLYCLHIKIFDVLEDDFSYMCLSPITLALSLAWNALLLFEHFYLALTCEEYFRLYIPMNFHLCMIVYQHYLLKFIYSRFEQKFICLQYQIFICIVLFAFSTVVFSYDLLFDCRFLTILCGFIWIPQIILNMKNGFTINNDGLILSLSLNFIFFPLSTKLWNSNIFELQPNYEWTKALLICVLTQVLICRLQEMWNCRFFINNCLKFKEVKILDFHESNFKCVICLSDTENNSDSKDIPTCNSKVVKTSCGHSFHYLCLRDCMKYKNECPLCRQKVFCNQIDRRRFHFYA